MEHLVCDDLVIWSRTADVAAGSGCSMFTRRIAQRFSGLKGPKSCDAPGSKASGPEGPEGPMTSRPTGKKHAGGAHGPFLFIVFLLLTVYRVPELQLSCS